LTNVILTPRAFLVNLHTELSWSVGFKAVAVHHGVDGRVEWRLLGAQVRVLVAVTLIALDGRAWRENSCV